MKSSTLKIDKKHDIILNYCAALGILLLLGIFLGAVLSQTQYTDTKNYYTYLINSILDSYKSGSFTKILFTSFFSCIILQLALLLSGFCCFGAPIIACTVFLKGLLCGCLSSYLYLQLGLKGAFLNIIIFWLPQVMQAVFITILAAITLDNSIALFFNTFTSKKQGTAYKLKRCIKFFVFTSLGLFISAIIESALADAFSSML